MLATCLLLSLVNTKKIDLGHKKMEWFGKKFNDHYYGDIASIADWSTSSLFMLHRRSNTHWNSILTIFTYCINFSFDPNRWSRVCALLSGPHYRYLFGIQKQMLGRINIFMTLNRKSIRETGMTPIDIALNATPTDS